MSFWGMKQVGNGQFLPGMCRGNAGYEDSDLSEGFEGRNEGYQGDGEGSSGGCRRESREGDQVKVKL